MENLIQSDNSTVSIKTNNHSKKTEIIRNKERANLCDTISQEIASFQKKSGIPGLYQSVVIVDVPSAETPQQVIQECSTHIRQNAHSWELKILETKTTSSFPAIFKCIPNSSIVKAVAKAGVLRVPSLISKLAGVLTFLMVMILLAIFSISSLKLFQLTIPLALIAFCSAAIGGYLIYWIVQNQTVSKFTIPTHAIEKISQNNGPISDNFFSAIANEVSGNLPLVIIIEDLSAVDEVSASVVKQILTGNNINNTGALLWVVFDKIFKSADTTFTNCDFSVKRYAMIQEES